MVAEPKAAPMPGRYGALLILLVASYLLAAFITQRWIEAVQVVLFTAAMLLALRSAAISRRGVRVVLYAASAGSPGTGDVPWPGANRPS